jgi:hypothetical protein
LQVRPGDSPGKAHFVKDLSYSKASIPKNRGSFVTTGKLDKELKN